MSIKRLSSFMPIAALACGLQTNAIAGVVISGEYYEQSVAIQECPGALTCALFLEPIPSDKKLDIQQINCLAIVDQSLRVLYMRAGPTQGSGGNREINFLLNEYVFSGGKYYYSIDEHPIYRMGASPYLTIIITSGAFFTGSFKCTVTGTLTPR